MAYIVRYGGQVPAEQRQSRRSRKKWRITAAVLLAAVAVRYFWGDEITRILIPGEDAITVEAFANFLNSLGQGEELGDCVTAFCREVIYGTP